MCTCIHAKDTEKSHNIILNVNRYEHRTNETNEINICDHKSRNRIQSR